MKQDTIKSLADIPRAVAWLSHWASKGMEGGKAVVIRLSHETRSEAQNRHQWALYRCFISSGIDWPRGSGYLPTEEEWKILFVSAYSNDSSRMTIGLAGEVVNFNYSSKALKKVEFSELIEFIYAEGTERGVTWNSPAIEIYNEWKL